MEIKHHLKRTVNLQSSMCYNLVGPVGCSGLINSKDNLSDMTTSFYNNILFISKPSSSWRMKEKDWFIN